MCAEFANLICGFRRGILYICIYVRVLSGAALGIPLIGAARSELRAEFFYFGAAGKIFFNYQKIFKLYRVFLRILCNEAGENGE